ncbi:MAG: TetR/AcrR family transcriptional regulator [Alphaproteobacteria bacterium]
MTDVLIDEAPLRRRGSLSRDEIVSAGLTIATTDDLNSLTMKTLAKALGVTPMAVYRHFENKAEIVDAVLDRLVQDAATTDHGIDPGQWQAWLKETFRRIHQTFLNAPGTLPMLDNLARFGPGLMEVFNDILGVLDAAGFTRDQAVQATSALISVTLGSVTIDAMQDRSVADILGGLETVDPAEVASLYPHIMGAAEALIASQKQPSVEVGINLMVASMEGWLKG